MENNNPYKVNNPYQNHDNHIKKMVKEKEKDDAQKAFDKILQSYQNSENNGLKLEKNYENIGSIKRYYNKYYLSNYVSFLFFLGSISFFVSFFTKLSVFAILIGLNFYIFFSKKLYLKSLFYTHSVDSEVKDNIYNYIFNHSNFKMFIILCFSLFSVATGISYFTKMIFLGQYVNTRFYKLLVKNLQSFDINNELFAYSILLSFILLIIFKVTDK